METETKTPEQISQILTDDGWTMTVTLVNPGDYKTPSDWTVTLTRNGASYSTEYRIGCAYRRWKEKLGFDFSSVQWKGQFPEQPREGGTVRLTPTQGGGITLFQEEFLRKYSEPIPPTLDRVLHCLTMDAEGVRHGQSFEEWAGEYGYNSDSRTDEGIYKACTDCWRDMVRLGADFDKLADLFQDY